MPPSKYLYSIAYRTKFVCKIKENNLNKRIIAQLLYLWGVYSVGHFWSPFHTTIEGVFRRLPINPENPISYKHSVSIG